MPTDESESDSDLDSDDSSPRPTNSSSETGPVEYRQPQGNAESETDSETADNAESGGSEENSEDSPDEEQADPGSISRIEGVLMDPDEILETIAYNGQEDIGRKGKAVFSLTPPFDETVEPTLKHLADDSTKSDADGEIHLRPFRFVVDGRRIIDQRPTRQLAMEELDVDDPDDAKIEAWIDEAMDTWKSYIRDNLTDSVDIFSPHGMTIVSVEYETGSE